MRKIVMTSHLVKVPAKLAMLPPMLRKAEGGSVTVGPCLQLCGHPYQEDTKLSSTTRDCNCSNFSAAHFFFFKITASQLNYLTIEIIYHLSESWIYPQALSTFAIFPPLFSSAKIANARRLPSHLKSISKQEQRQMAAAQFKPAQDPASPLHCKYYL